MIIPIKLLVNLKANIDVCLEVLFCKKQELLSIGRNKFGPVPNGSSGNYFDVNRQKEA